MTEWTFAQKRAALGLPPRDTDVDAYAAVTDPQVLAVLDVLAPRFGDGRSPIFEWGHEETPSGAEMVDLAGAIVAALRGPT